MIEINILHGSSCVGKSTIMNKNLGLISNLKNKVLISNMYTDDNQYQIHIEPKLIGVNKIEMDDCKYWRFKELDWSDICINFLIEQIIKNMHRKNMIMTCGGLPLPGHDVYTQLEKEYSVNFFHTLVLVKDIEKYKSYIKKRKSDDVMSELLQQYKWRESTKELYDLVIYN
jgi:hypothetical protein